jgi:NADH-quinone oxidoreductase subunit G
MCLVETNKAPKLLPACHATVMPDMEVKTRSPRVIEARKGVLQFILLHHPVDCPICDQAGECLLQDNYDQHSLAPSEHEFRKNHKAKAEDLGPHVMLDAERCILCTRCIRFCDEIAKQTQLGIKHRGNRSEITTYPGQPLDHPYSLCTVDLCPVGALTSKDFRFKKRVWFLSHTDTICTGCARGCNVRADHHEGVIYRLVPRFNAEVNRWWACDEGRLSFHRYEAGRLVRARVGGGDVTEGEALVYAAELVKDGALVDLAVSELLPLEDLFLAFAFAKAHLGGRPVHVTRRPDGVGDEVLVQADKNPNGNGLRQLAAHFGLELTTMGALQATSGRTLLALCPEVPDMCPLAGLPAQGVNVVLTGTFDGALARSAAVALPTLSPFERGGTYVNAAGVVQQAAKVVEGPEVASSPWVHLRNLARVAGCGEHFPSTREQAREAVLRALAEGRPQGSPVQNGGRA